MNHYSQAETFVLVLALLGGALFALGLFLFSQMPQKNQVVSYVSFKVGDRLVKGKKTKFRVQSKKQVFSYVSFKVGDRLVKEKERSPAYRRTQRSEKSGGASLDGVKKIALPPSLPQGESLPSWD